ncbi:dihydrofolate reductase family protein [Flavihumibacter solisilvae]|uniref:Dihydrofolate reductase n=1 Tax=Flavihumibacter solisilvae TaxID=1349421 RepID=A0A0C1L4Q2_9BACT|nr:dihydrofolate reductase family protein [Flavihumibacter solisilvae]KIC94511.1 dihydrofolate reductase [Flavihumibacter solisilvae]
MRKVIAAINMTLDGFCDHTVITPDEEIHQYYADMLNEAGVVLYGRTTYLLMEDYWPAIVANPTGDKSTDEFAVAIDKVPKIVFSHSLKNVNWASAKLANKDIEETVLELKQQPGKDIYACSPGLIVSLANLKLIDEYQLCIHPVIAAGGLALFKNINEKTTLNLIKTKTFGSGAVTLYYLCSKL